MTINLDIYGSPDSLTYDEDLLRPIAVSLRTPGTATYVVWDEEHRVLRFGGEEFVTKSDRKCRVERDRLSEPLRSALGGDLCWTQYEFELARGRDDGLAGRILEFRRAIDQCEGSLGTWHQNPDEQMGSSEDPSNSSATSTPLRGLRNTFHRLFPLAGAGPGLGQSPKEPRERGRLDAANRVKWMCIALNPYHQFRPWCLPVRGHLKDGRSIRAHERGLAAARTPLDVAQYHTALVDLRDAKGTVSPTARDFEDSRVNVIKASLPSLLWPAAFPADGQTQRVPRHAQKGSVLCVGLITEGAIMGATRHLEELPVESEVKARSIEEANDWRWEELFRPLVQVVMNSPPMRGFMSRVRNGIRLPTRQERERKAARDAGRWRSEEGTAMKLTSEGEQARRRSEAEGCPTTAPDGRASSLASSERATRESAWMPGVLANLDRHAERAALTALAGPASIDGYPKIDGAWTGESWAGRDVAELAQRILEDQIEAHDQRLYSREQKVMKRGEAQPDGSGDASITAQLEPLDGGATVAELRSRIADFLDLIASAEVGLEVREQLAEPLAEMGRGLFLRGDMIGLREFEKTLVSYEAMCGAEEGITVRDAFKAKTGLWLSDAVTRLSDDVQHRPGET